jgi:hypothetical protein
MSPNCLAAPDDIDPAVDLLRFKPPAAVSGSRASSGIPGR